VVDRVRKIPVGVPHAAPRLRDDALELNVRQLARLLAVGELLANLIDLEVSEQRLRVLQVQVRSNLRAVALEQTCRREPRAVPRGAVRAAPWQRLVDADSRVEIAVQDAARAACQRAGGLLRLRIAREVRRQIRRPERPRLRDADVLNLR